MGEPRGFTGRFDKRGMKTAASFQQKNIRVAGIVGMLAALADISLQYGPTG